MGNQPQACRILGGGKGEVPQGIGNDLVAVGIEDSGVSTRVIGAVAVDIDVQLSPLDRAIRYGAADNGNVSPGSVIARDRYPDTGSGCCQPAQQPPVATPAGIAVILRQLLALITRHAVSLGQHQILPQLSH